jgi:hypothetical protein
MTTINVVKNDQGKLVGLSAADKKAYVRFRKKLDDLEPGEYLQLDYWFDRNPKLHKLHFVVVGALFDQQEQFSDPDTLRKWLYVGAGYCDFFPGPRGKMCAIPKSINWKSIDDADFQVLHDKVVDFARSPAATGFLWPHLDAEQQSEMIAAVMDGFERDQG